MARENSILLGTYNHHSSFFNLLRRYIIPRFQGEPRQRGRNIQGGGENAIFE